VGGWKEAARNGRLGSLSSLSKNLEQIQSRIERAAESVGRDPNEVTLIAVSKTVTVDQMRVAYDLGVRHFGESRWQEAEPKLDALPKDIVWHFIGKLQSNKARKVAERFSVIHTLESGSQLKEIAKAGRDVDVLIEVNIANEVEKSGLNPSEAAEFKKTVLEYSQANFRGLMSIGPAHQNEEMMRPYFQAVATLNREMAGKWLSLGMSGDFEVAIQEGSTHVRIGSALFGARQ
jgi:PLP dependent protein